MITILKWVIGALLGGLVWLVAMYTDEYFRPYKNIKTNKKDK
jgi:hypothetical protein